MGQATLVEAEVVSTASEMVASLTRSGIKLSVALWMTSPEFEDGRLVLASSVFDQTDLLSAYERVTLVMQEEFVHPLPAILILSMKDPFIRELRRLFAKANNVEGMRLGGQMIGSRFIVAAYVFTIR